MAISRSQISRQLQNRGGITNISPRQNFGLGSKLKRFVRKIIPNEVSKVATTAAPFVAPFNPALAAGMAGIGSFDQSGSLSDALKRGALTYGGGQAARYIGGAGFQGNPFQGDVLGNFTSFSSPIGTDTGLGKFFADRRMPNTEIAEISEVAETGPKTFRESMADINLQRGTTDTGNIISPEYGDMLPNVYETASNVGPTIDVIKAETITKDPNFVSSLVNKVQNQDYAGAGGEVLDAFKKVGKAVFMKDGQLDKPMVLGTAAFALSFAEAKAIANEAGVTDYTEAQYDEDQKAEKKAEYASYLTNFFAGKKEGGRIGFENGGIDMIALEENVRKYPEMVNEITDIEPGVAEAGEPVSPESTIFIKFDKEKEEADLLQEILRELEADGGRIGLMSGSGGKKKYGQGIESAVKQIDPLQGGLDELKMGGGGGLPLAFTRLEKSFLFKHLAKLGGADRSFTMPQLYRILNNPSKFPKDATMLKEFLKIKGFSKGGDVGSVNEIPVRTNKAGVKELDMRATGGFVPIGVKEKADDVPAMLSKNEFVLTADAVRGIGGGSVEKGSEKLYNVMKQAEQVGKA
tara:strand:+ start:1646 stop:3376 length:1731 start_codon:yes stop_codon:yes gene_type:complete